MVPDVELFQASKMNMETKRAVDIFFPPLIPELGRIYKEKSRNLDTAAVTFFCLTIWEKKTPALFPSFFLSFTKDLLKPSLIPSLVSTPVYYFFNSGSVSNNINPEVEGWASASASAVRCVTSGSLERSADSTH